MRMTFLGLLLILTACAAQSPVTGPGLPDGTRTVSYLPDASDFPNPERGFHDDVSLVGLSADSRIGLSAPDITLVRGYVRLDDWRHSDLPVELLDSLQAGFDAVRANGLKVIPRFIYNWGEGADAPLEQVLRHIGQLQPLLAQNSDVIAVLQAGFIGKWGEWHGSEYGLTSEVNKRLIGEALLTAVPEQLMVQFRTPRHSYHVLGTEEPLAAAAAFSFRAQARSGFMNDCFLASWDDAGTFGNDADRTFAAQQARYTVTGGETCDIALQAERIRCGNAVIELERYGWDYLNSGYFRDILQGWHDEGCYQEVRQRLGYRYELASATLLTPADGVAPQLRLTISNSGFGKLYNPRPLQIILVNSRTGNEVTHTVSSDARLVLPLAGQERTITTQLPLNLEAGTWELFLALPDGHASLAGDSRYSIRLAATLSDGTSVWVPTAGRNRLGLNLTVPEY